MSSQEELKLSDLQPQPQANSQAIKWLWQSDVDPWKEKDPTKWKWSPYSGEHFNLIEDASSQGHKVADLGDYEVDLKRMLQINKKDRSRVRRIKREPNIVPQSRFMLDISVPVSVEKIQQTINPAFGTVQHFLDFIMKRTSETYTLFQRLKGLNLSCKQDEFQDVIQAVTKCIQRAAESNKKVTKSNSPIQEAKQILSDIKIKSKNPDLTLREFLKVVLRVYTEESFVCYWLNELLRSESWAEINVFTPYLVCLAYTFQMQDYVIPYEEPQGVVGRFSSLFRAQKLTLYRGTTLAEEHLRLYDPKKTGLFSWNGVTSTSRTKDQALKFVRLSQKRASPGEKKISVLFVIEADFASVIDSEGMIDISKDSKYPKEQEVILAPGSVFEVTDFQLKQADDIYEVKLALRKKFNGDHKILGDLQARIMTEKTVILNDFTYEDIIKALPLIEGNQLVESLMIQKCQLDCHLMELIDEMRRSTNIKEENILLRDNTITVDRLTTLCYYFSLANLGQICSENTIVIKTDLQNANGKIENYSLKEVKVEKKTIKELLKKNLFYHFCQDVLIHSEILCVNLSIKDLLPSKGHLDTLITSLQRLENLQHLSLNLKSNRFASNRTLEQLQNAVQSWESLRYLSLSFAYCANITSEGIKSFTTDLKHCKHLSDLSLNFVYCGVVQNDFLESLNTLISSLDSLQNLMLNLTSYGSSFFEEGDVQRDILLIAREELRIKCDRASDKDLKDLNNTLKSLNLLKKLEINCPKCPNITDNGILNLADGLKLLPSLTNIYLDFGNCDKISDEAIDKLQDSLKLLSGLTHIHLDFESCNKISDKGIKKLKDALKLCTSLSHLHLGFGNCNKITDKGIKKLKSALKSQTLLTHLHLDFTWCTMISDTGISKLRDLLKYHTAITHLYLDFTWCTEISDKGIEKLEDALKSLTSITNMYLSFKGCNQISDGGIDKLKDVLKSLNALTHLHLDFGNVNKISDKGISDLKEALMLLCALTHLYLNFEGCFNISDDGIDQLKNAFKTLCGLTHLCLNFECCFKISDRGLDKINDAVMSLSSLTHLQLDFISCENISEGGKDKLRNSVKSKNLLICNLYFKNSIGIPWKMRTGPFWCIN